MIFPICLQDRTGLPVEIIRYIKSFLNQDQVLHFPMEFSHNLIQKLMHPHLIKMYDAVHMPSYYDYIRKSQLSSKHGFEMKWKRYEIHKNPNVLCYKTKKITYNHENSLQYFFSIYDTACIKIPYPPNGNARPFTERTCCLKISLHDSFNFYLDTLDYVTSLVMQRNEWKNKIQIQHRDGYIWIWWRQDIFFEFFENYVSRYSQIRRICLFKHMDHLCFLIHRHFRYYFESPLFQYMFQDD